jgi:hypothetical protein
MVSYMLLYVKFNTVSYISKNDLINQLNIKIHELLDKIQSDNNHIVSLQRGGNIGFQKSKQLILFKLPAFQSLIS